MREVSRTAVQVDEYQERASRRAVLNEGTVEKDLQERPCLVEGQFSRKACF